MYKPHTPYNVPFRILTPTVSVSETGISRFGSGSPDELPSKPPGYATYA